MSNGWDNSALAWIESLGEQGNRGDWGRQNVLDPVMMARVAKGGFRKALEAPIDLTQQQYEALHDGKHVELNCPPRDQFVIARTGSTYDTAFQDLGVDYYDFVS